MIYNVDALRKAYQAGERFKYLFFWGHTPPADGVVNQSCLSQWWMSRFEVNGVVYSCTEQYMMAEKARLFGDQEMLEAIMKAKHPKEMKAYGRAVAGYDDAKWNEASYGIVKVGNWAKFSQNEELKKYLLGTGKRILVEASPRDRIWGIGMGKSNPDAECPPKWRGKNKLGFVLTEVRDELLSQLAEAE
jgi:ribA/ribD-fused uncharacterized protein